MTCNALFEQLNCVQRKFKTREYVLWPVSTKNESCKNNSDYSIVHIFSTLHLNGNVWIDIELQFAKPTYIYKDNLYFVNRIKREKGM